MNAEPGGAREAKRMMVGEAAFACGPIAGRRVDERHLQPTGLDLGSQRVGVDAVGDQDLDATQPVGSRSSHAFERWQVGEEPVDVGGELRGHEPVARSVVVSPGR